MDNNVKFEIKRKIFHFFSLIYILIYFYISKYFSPRAALLTLTFILILLFFIEFIKIKYDRSVPFFQFLYRKREKNNLSGSIFLLLGVIIAFAVFDFEIAVVAILMMIFGDMTAAIVGLTFGKHWLKNIPRASWEGIIAEFIVNLIVGIIFLPYFLVVLIMALTATFIETVLISSDDNLAVPVLAGFAGKASLVFFRIIGIY